MEEKINGEYYADVMYHEDNFLIKSSDLSLKKDFVTPDDDTWKTEEPVKLYTYTKGGYLYKGPSKKYDKVMAEEIPVGTVLTYENYSYGWAYVNYDNNKGWVFIYQKDDRSNPYDDNTSFAYLTNETVITVPGTTLIDDNGDKILDINDFTEVKINYYLGYLDAYPGASKYNVNYKGTIGWIDTTTKKNEKDDTVYIFDDVDIMLNSKKIGTIPKNTEIKYDYYTQQYQDSPLYYVNYKGKSGWISDWEHILYNELLSEYGSSDSYILYQDFDL